GEAEASLAVRSRARAALRPRKAVDARERALDGRAIRVMRGEGDGAHRLELEISEIESGRGREDRSLETQIPDAFGLDPEREGARVVVIDDPDPEAAVRTALEGPGRDVVQPLGSAPEPALKASFDSLRRLSRRIQDPPDDRRFRVQREHEVWARGIDRERELAVREEIGRA